MRAMAELGVGPYKSGDVASKLGRKTPEVSMIRQRLLDKGLVYATEDYGYVEFTVHAISRAEDASEARANDLIERAGPRTNIAAFAATGRSQRRRRAARVCRGAEAGIGSVGRCPSEGCRAGPRGWCRRR